MPAHPAGQASLRVFETTDYLHRPRELMGPHEVCGPLTCGNGAACRNRTDDLFILVSDSCAVGEGSHRDVAGTESRSVRSRHVPSRPHSHVSVPVSHRSNHREFRAIGSLVLVRPKTGVGSSCMVS